MPLNTVFGTSQCPLTPGKLLKNAMTVQMDIPSDRSLVIIGGTNGTWLLHVYHTMTRSQERLYYITQKGTVKFIGKYRNSKVCRGKYIFSNEDGDIFIIDTSNDTMINTNLNEFGDEISVAFRTCITDYGEFAYVKNGILNIPDRNISVKIMDQIESIGLNYYTTFNYTTGSCTSYNLYDNIDVVPKTKVYEDKLIPYQRFIEGINHEYYYVKEIAGIFEKVYSTCNNRLVGTLAMPVTLSETDTYWDNKIFNFEYTQVIVKQKTNSGYFFTVYQH